MSIFTLIMLVILLSFMIGYKFKINIGIVSVTFAFLIGILLLNLKPGQVISLLPANTVFLFVCVTMFYGYAVENGTLEYIACRLLSSLGKFSWAVPPGVFLVCAVLAGIGAGAPAVTAFMAPIGMVLALHTTMAPLLVAIAITAGALCGSNFYLSQGGIIIRSLLEEYSFQGDAPTVTFSVFINTVIIYSSIFIISYFALQGHKTKIAVQLDKPAACTASQRKNVILIITVISLIVVPVIISKFIFPLPNAVLNCFDIHVVMLFGIIISAILKLGDEKLIIRKHVPWNTIILICGISMLLKIAEMTGFSTAIAGFITTNLPVIVIVPVFVIVAALMSIFSPAVSVVTPMLLPIAIELSSHLGIAPSVLASAIVVGACSTSISPLSAAGSILYAACPAEKKPQRLFGQMLLCSLIFMLYITLLSVLGIFTIF